MFWEGSDDNTVQHNVIHDISIRGVDCQTANNVIIDNEIYNMGGDGIAVSIPGVEIRDNLIYNGEGYGIHLYSGSGDGVIENNVVIGFETGGINLHESDNSHVEHNDFYENGKHQAWDYASSNIFTDNYWHEWIANDTNGNGILDLPKLIAGGDNTDPRPHASPINPIPSWYDFVPITGPLPEPEPEPTEPPPTTIGDTTTISTSGTSTSPTNTTTSSISQTTGESSMLQVISGAGAISVIVVVFLLIRRKG
jgi:parallel beta-helix repeat protein